MNGAIEGKYISRNTSLNYILVFLLVILFSDGSSITLSQLWNGILTLPMASETIQIIAVILILLMLLSGKSKIKFQSFRDVSWLVMPLLVTVLSLISISLSVETNISVNTLFQTSIHVFIIFFLVFYCKKSYSRFDSNKVAKFVVTVGVIEALLGIYQHITHNTIFDPTLLNSIYFLNGLSSSNILFLKAGASIRAFGTFDSGLSLGIFLIMCLAITLDFTNFSKKIKIVQVLIFSISISFTLTRNVYIGFSIFIFVYMFMRIGIKDIIVRFLYILVALVSASLFWLSDLLSWLITLASHVNISTFGARFIYMKLSISRIPDITHFLFGSNIRSERSLPIDSTVIATIAQYGAIFAIIVSFVLYLIFRSVVLDKQNGKIHYPAIGAFLFILPVMGASNSLLVALLISSAIICLLFNANSQII